MVTGLNLIQFGRTQINTFEIFYTLNRYQIMLKIILLCFFAMSFSMLGMTQVDSTKIDESLKPPPDIRVHLHWKWGYSNLASPKNEHYDFSGLRGFGVSLEINRWLTSVNLDFRQRPKRKLFQRVYEPQIKLDVNYRVFDVKKHQIYLGASAGVFIGVNTFTLSGDVFNTLVARKVPAIFSGARLSYRKLCEWHVNKSFSVLPELFAEFGALFTGVLHSAAMSESSVKPEPAYWGHNFALGLKFSLVKLVKPKENNYDFEFD